MISTAPKFLFVVLTAVLVFTAGCTPPPSPVESTPLNLPTLEPLLLTGRPLQVVATTSIVGDVVGAVGRDAINLTTLIKPGQDPHSYEPTAQAMTMAAGADVIFVNGWGLEEGLALDLADLDRQGVLVPISAGIEPLYFEENGERVVDPHVWWRIDNVKLWAETAADVLGRLDPAQAAVYQDNAAAYQAELDELLMETSALMEQIPVDKRQLVTSHDALGYLAADFGLEIVGTVIPGSSTLAEPAAADLAALIESMEEKNVCTIFTEVGESDNLAQTIAGELDHCETVDIVPLFSDALGAAGSGADSYIGFYKATVASLSNALK